MQYEIHNMDCIAAMRQMADASVDSIVTDPPYELGFMGRAWDATGIANSVEMWREALRVLKPGGHLLAFSGSRTYHRMACAIEDAGFEIRDQIMWVYGSGFPKSLDVSKAIDKIGGVDTSAFKMYLSAVVASLGKTRAAIDAECGFTMRFDTPYEKDPGNWGSSLPSPEKWSVIARVLGIDASKWAALIDRVWRGRAGGVSEADEKRSFGQHYERTEKGEAVLDAARQWDGWGTALKPAHEPICVARKPLIGTVAANVLAHGTGALNIDGCRVEFQGDADKASAKPQGRATSASGNLAGKAQRGADRAEYEHVQGAGRWPANLIHDGSDEVRAAFPDSNGSGPARTLKRGTRGGESWGMADEPGELRDAGVGSAARFFYCPKAGKSDRENGNTHPTVKPTDLMAYLVRLITPPGGLVLDPFMGSGSTGKACMREGFRFVGCELSAEYAAIAGARILSELSGGLL